MAERLLQAGLDELFPREFAVQSAGTQALVGRPIDTTIAMNITDLGGTADDFAARQLTPEILADQDLILALTREHRSRIVELQPTKLRQTFTLREFSTIASKLTFDREVRGASRWKEVTTKVLRARSVFAVPPEEQDVLDPYRRSGDVYKQSASQIEVAIHQLIQI